MMNGARMRLIDGARDQASLTVVHCGVFRRPLNLGCMVFAPTKRGEKMTLLERLGTNLPRRYYMSADVGYKEHVAIVISLETFVRGDGSWKRATCSHFPSTQAGLSRLQGYLDGFSTDLSEFFGLWRVNRRLLWRICVSVSPGPGIRHEPGEECND
jgi:hypothetical protein